MRVSKVAAIAAAAVVVGVVSGERGQAQRAPASGGVVSIVNARVSANAAGAVAAAAADVNYWTAERLATATPLNVKANTATLDEPVDLAAAGQAMFGEGSKPTSGVPLNLSQPLFDKSSAVRELRTRAGARRRGRTHAVRPRHLRAQYSSSRLVPTTANTLSLSNRWAVVLHDCGPRQLRVLGIGAASARAPHRWPLRPRGRRRRGSMALELPVRPGDQERRRTVRQMGLGDGRDNGNLVAQRRRHGSQRR